MTAQSHALPLAGKSALVTGGAGGIGSASAEALLRDGCSVVLMGRRRDTLEQARSRLLPAANGGARIALSVGDAMQSDDVRHAVALAAEFNGRFDICVSTVGIGSLTPLIMHDEHSVMQQIANNVQPTFLAIRHSIPLMAANGGGSIVCISSEAASRPSAWLSIYTTAKAAVEGLVKAAANELGRHKIRVNAVRPGPTRTDATTDMFLQQNILDHYFSRALGRLGEPADIGAAVRYLAGPESSWVTGESLAVNGGGDLHFPVDATLWVTGYLGQEVMDKVLAGIDPAA
ncbi:MAG: 7-alpha-hydroxysteroid dehydrogenase [Hydrocarboniphaga sp.]|uniref:SDR family NAD(P)-dependent oxidoreductase n=1 Tax=Hydrocarboniphaga sp. TaxID=2033016 RepID=UPI0026360054|nr:SDR family oxidoreductase [Hydrocarboniphaga sp.]MDB5971385.1 7-alpha-hydroxysteroid dehydrogenase [Hydrocarboniphaga sp.]